MKTFDIRNPGHAEASSPAIRQLHGAALVTRSATVLSALQIAADYIVDQSMPVNEPAYPGSEILKRLVK